MITPSNHPIKFLLPFEWVLLTVACLLELPQLPLGPERSPLLSFSLILSFAALGYYLPNREPKLKAAHFILSFSILVVGIFLAKIRLMPLFFVIFIVRSSFMLHKRTRIFVTIAAFSLALVHQVDRVQDFQTRRANREFLRQMRPRQPFFDEPPRGWRRDQIREDRIVVGAISSTMLLGLVLTFLQLMIEAVLSARDSHEQLQQANDRLRRYALRVEDVATLQERNRIAREIHDSLGHSLTAFNLHVEAALRLLKSDPEEAQALLVEAKQLGSTALKEVRQSVSTLRSNPLQGKSLQGAIQSLLEDFTRSTQIQPTTEFEGLETLPADQAMALYRIIQEALTNITKYAQATAVQICLKSTPQQTQLQIRDNGRGFDQHKTSSGFGVQGMRERTRAIGGTYHLASQIGQGTQITVTIP